MPDFHVTPRALADLGWSQLTAAVAARATSVRGAELAASLPFLGVDEAQAQLAAIEEARTLLRRQLPLPIGQVDDVRGHVARADKGAVLSAAELLACAAVGRTAGAVRRFALGLEADAPLLAGRARH